MYELISSDKELNQIIAYARESLHELPRNDRPAVHGAAAQSISMEQDGLSRLIIQNRPVIQERPEEVREFGRGALEIPIDEPERIERAIDEPGVLLRKGLVVQNPEAGYYIYKESGRYYRCNIITDGIWEFTYPILADVIPSINRDGEFNPNIVICKRQTAKKLVYWKTYNFIDKFTPEILDRNNFHLVRKENMKSYADESLEKFYKEANHLIGIKGIIDANKSEKEYERLLHMIKHSKYPNTIAYSSIFRITRGNVIYCWPSYSIVTLDSAKVIVYWQKSSKGKNRRIKFPDLADFVKSAHRSGTLHDANPGEAQQSGISRHRLTHIIARDRHIVEPVRDRERGEPIRDIDRGLPVENYAANYAVDAENVERTFVSHYENRYRPSFTYDEGAIEEVQVGGEDHQIREEEVQVAARGDTHRENVQTGIGTHTVVIEDQDEEEVQVRGEDRIIEDDF